MQMVPVLIPMASVRECFFHQDCVILSGNVLHFLLNIFKGGYGCRHEKLNYFLWLRITDEGSVPEMCIWSIFVN